MLGLPSLQNVYPFRVCLKKKTKKGVSLSCSCKAHPEVFPGAPTFESPVQTTVVVRVDNLIFPDELIHDLASSIVAMRSSNAPLDVRSVDSKK